MDIRLKFIEGFNVVRKKKPIQSCGNSIYQHTKEIIMSYTRQQIKEAIRLELIDSDFLGEDKERFYTIVGIVMAGLDKLEMKNNKQKNNEGDK
jgi:hypothetical protein